MHARARAVDARCPHCGSASRRVHGRYLRRLSDAAVVTGHVRDFATMMQDLTSHNLPAWMGRVEDDELPALRSLVNGLRRDQEAVIAGLTSPWSSGQVEGQNTRVKRIKRDGYGRADFDLLRARILHRT
nr:transposase [Streptacidiphilus anmyonensis]